jgi:hypothetical protein
MFQVIQVYTTDKDTRAGHTPENHDTPPRLCSNSHLSSTPYTTNCSLQLLMPVCPLVVYASPRREILRVTCLQGPDLSTYK